MGDGMNSKLSFCKNNSWFPFHFSISIISALFFINTAFPIDIPLTITNRENAAKTAEPVTSGVPFAQGSLFDNNVNSIKIISGQTEIPASFNVTAHWPDGSVRWLMIDFQTDLPASGSVSVTLRTSSPPASFSGITVNDQPNSISVNTGSTEFNFNKNELRINGNYFEITSGAAVYRAIPNNYNWTVEESNKLKTVIKVTGNLYDGSYALNDTLVSFQARLVFFRNKDIIRAYVTLKNNNCFGWDAPQSGTAFSISSANLGIPLLPPAGNYSFGHGVEKTWEIELPVTGTPRLLETRYSADGTVAPGFTAPHPLALATPEYYIATQAWGKMTLPKTGFAPALQEDFDRFEKLHRSMVIPADLENPTNVTGITLWEHLYQDINSWNDYGDIRWGGDCGTLSGNHYDWSYGMFTHFMRTGRLQFLDAARILAKHEIDFDIYHTNVDGNAFNYQKNWETRPSHNSPDNCFGGGRPTHTWTQGYTLYWLITGDLRGKDAFDEMMEGIREYIYESFNVDGYVATNEIRLQGWLTDNLVTLWRVKPAAVFQTSQYGTKTIQAAIKDVLRNVFDLEREAGNHGYVYAGDPALPNLRHSLQDCYFVEPAIKAYSEIFKGRDAVYADSLFGLIRRMTDWLMSVTYGGDTNPQGQYRPLQIPVYIDTTLAQQTEGQLLYLLMASNAAGFCFSETANNTYKTYARAAFQDYIRYLGVTGGDQYIDDLTQRTPTCFNSNIYFETESKIHGWSNRYGQYYLASEILPPSTYSVSGIITYDNSVNTPLGNVKAYLKNGSAVIDSTTSNSAGWYEFTNISNGIYSLEFKNSAAWAGANATDALIIARYSVELDPLSAFRARAADVNGIPPVNATDALLVVRRFITQISSFPAGDWVFDLSPVVVSGGNVTQNIKALCYGDVNGSDIPGVAKTNSSVTLRSSGIVNINSKNEFELPVRINKVIELGAINLGFSFSEDQIEITGITSKPEDMVFYSNNGTLKIGWFGIKPLLVKENGILFTIHGKVKQNLVNQQINFSLVAESELANSGGIVEKGLEILLPVLGSQMPKEYSLSQNFPNPFNPITTIKYSLPEESSVKITVYNTLGEVVKQLVNSVQPAGFRDVEFNAGSLASGVYFYNIEAKTIDVSKEFRSVKKLILLK